MKTTLPTRKIQQLIINILRGAFLAITLTLAGCMTPAPTLEFRTPDGLRITQRGAAAAPATITQTRPDNTTFTLTGPTAQAAPTPAQKAQGWLTYIFYFGMAGGAALAIYGLGWGGKMLTTGGLCIAGGAAIAQWLNSHPGAFVMIGIGAALALVGPWLWHTLLKHRITPAPAAP